MAMLKIYLRSIISTHILGSLGKLFPPTPTNLIKSGKKELCIIYEK
jgi:hypothetical protein